MGGLARGWVPRRPQLQLLHRADVLGPGLLFPLRGPAHLLVCEVRQAVVEQLATAVAGVAFGLLYHRCDLSVFGDWWDGAFCWCCVGCWADEVEIVVYWAILYPRTWFPTRFGAWSNVCPTLTSLYNDVG